MFMCTSPGLGGRGVGHVLGRRGRLPALVDAAVFADYVFNNTCVNPLRKESLEARKHSSSRSSSQLSLKEAGLTREAAASC